MNLPAFALRKRSIVTAGVMLLMLWGAASYNAMPRREDPEFIIRTCQVLSQWPGAPTEQMEDLVTAPLEEEINGLDGVRWVRSETTVGRSAIFVELDRSTPGEAVTQMWDKVRSRVERVAMPDPAVKPVVIDDFGDTNVMLLAVHQVPLPGAEAVRPEDRYTPREMEVFAQRLSEEIKLLPGVAKVSLEGVRQEVVFVETDLGTWSKLALTSSQLEQLVSARNVLAAGGSLDTDAGRFSIKPSGDLDAVEELDAIVVARLGADGAGVPVSLEDLGLRVERSYADPPASIARYADATLADECILVAFTMKSGANVVDVCAATHELLKRLTEVDKILPPDVGIGLVSDQSENVVKKIADFMNNVIGAILIVVIVVYLMVGLRSASVMAANIPLVVIGSLALMPLFGVQLEQISLAAMIIALGMLVDNAVQICDQTRSLIQTEGLSPADAARKGAAQLAFPVLIATGTTIAAFYPMLIGLQGSTREFIYSLPVTLTITLGLSYVLAMTFCVLLATWFIRAPADPEASLSPVVRWLQRGRPRAPKPPADQPSRSAYAGFVRAALGMRGLVLAVSFGSLFLVLSLPVGNEFFPQDIRDQFTVDVWLPEGTAIAQTADAARQVEDILRALSPATDADGAPVERLRALCTVVGKGAPRWYLGRTPEAPRANFAELVVRTSEGALTPGYVADLRRVLAEGDADLGLQPVAGARVIPRELMMGPVVDAPIGVRIYGPRSGAGFADLPLMHEQADRLKAILRDWPGTDDVYDTWGSPAYQLDIDVDPDKANLAGVTNAGVARTLNAYFSGHPLTTFREGDHQVPVHLRLSPGERGSLDVLRGAYVEGLDGKVPLDAVADVTPSFQPARIDRRFLQRVLEVRSRTLPGVRANDIVLALLDSPEFAAWEQALPPGYTWEIGGELFESQQSKSELGLSLLISVLLIVLLLVVQYDGFAKPLIILSTIPLALIGALLGLYVMGYPLGFMPQLGVLSLFGIVVNTAIIFIDVAERLVGERAARGGSGPIAGLSVAEFRECLVSAGEQRLLPISMTTLTTIGGLLPLGLAGGPLWEGMAWLMIFGLAVATLLTLFVVPCLYAIFVERFGMSPLGQAEA